MLGYTVVVNLITDWKDIQERNRDGKKARSFRQWSQA